MTSQLPRAAPVKIHDYERDPAAIYRRSFSIVRAEADLTALPPETHDMAIRLIHACGMTDIAAGLKFSPDIISASQTAFAHGRPILCDVEMVANGVIRSRLPKGAKIICTLNDPRAASHAKALGLTRSAAAVDLWADHLEGAIVAIGNAPTALFHLLERIAEGFPRPAAILGFPVGFVGAAESKAALTQQAFGLPFATLEGRRGGSAMAAAAVNALAAGLPEERAQ